MACVAPFGCIVACIYSSILQLDFVVHTIGYVHVPWFVFIREILTFEKIVGVL